MRNVFKQMLAYVQLKTLSSEVISSIKEIALNGWFTQN